MSEKSLNFAYRAVSGVFIRRGIREPVDVLSRRPNSLVNVCKVMKYSNTGRYFAYCDRERTICVDTSTGDELFSHQLPRTSNIMFSPDDTLMITFQPYVIYGVRIDAEGNPRTPDSNLRFFSVRDGGKLLATLIQKDHTLWQPQFTDDGKTFVMLEQSEVHFHSSATPECIDRKAVIKGIENLAIAPGQNPVIAAFVPSKGDSPSWLSLRNFHDDLSAICQRATSVADKCDFKWNQLGSAVVATIGVKDEKITQTSNCINCVYLLNKNGDAIQVALNKEGRVHSIQWAPDGTQFAVCYGIMPAKVCIFNLKGSVVWDLGEGHFNALYYNTFGSILATCRIDTISAGNIFLWDTEKRSKILHLEVPSTTNFEWAPDGQHFLTATTSPQLRSDNNFRVWNYQGECLLENLMFDEVDGVKKQIELAQVTFMPAPDHYQPFEIKPPTEAQKASASKFKNPDEKSLVNSPQKTGLLTSKEKYIPSVTHKGTSHVHANPVHKAVCFVCLQPGHISRSCPNKFNTSYLVSSSTSPTSTGHNVGYVSGGVNKRLPERDERKYDFAVVGCPDELIINTNWKEAGFSTQLLENVRAMKLHKPNKFQSIAVPLICKGFDVKAHVDNASGKAVAFLLAIIHKLQARFRADPDVALRRMRVSALVVVPKHEFARDLYDLAVKLADKTGVRPNFTRPDQEVQANINSFVKDGCDILIGTPGRLLNLIPRGTIKVDRLKFFVLDGANHFIGAGVMDHLFNLCKFQGFPEADECQVLFFSSVPFDDKIDEFADMACREDAVRITRCVGWNDDQKPGVDEEPTVEQKTTVEQDTPAFKQHTDRAVMEPVAAPGISSPTPAPGTRGGRAKRGSLAAIYEKWAGKPFEG